MIHQDGGRALHRGEPLKRLNEVRRERRVLLDVRPGESAERVEEDEGQARPPTHDEYERSMGMGFRRGGEDVYAGAEWWRK